MGILVLLIAGGLSTWLWSRARTLPPRLILVVPNTPPQTGLNPSQEAGLRELFRIHLEAVGKRPVMVHLESPGAMDLTTLADKDVMVRPRFERSGDQLRLHLEVGRVRVIRQKVLAPWEAWVSPLETPQAALARAGQFLAGADPDDSPLEPSDPAAFWKAVEIEGLLVENERVHLAVKLAEDLVEADPETPLAHLLLADAAYRIHLREATASPATLAKVETHFRKAVARGKGYPEASAQWAEAKVEAGEHRRALEILWEGLRKHPNSPILLSGLAYAARISGQLELATLACEARRRLVPQEVDPFIAENTFLYTGDLDKFETTLRDRPGHRYNSLVWFYRGYLTQMKGQRDGAIAAYQHAEAWNNDIAHFNRLAGILRLHLEGKGEEALGLLQVLDRERAGLRVPDGEFTFKIAEAYALLGHREKAVDVAYRAFGHGFVCARWYAKSPFLQAVQPMPRYRALVHSVEERQALLARSFPVTRFF